MAAVWKIGYKVGMSARKTEATLGTSNRRDFVQGLGWLHKASKEEKDNTEVSRDDTDRKQLL